MIGIVGGGISGLFLLHFLRERGVDAVLFEAAEVPGGVMKSLTVQGPSGSVTADLGPQRMRLTAGLGQVVDRVGLRSLVLRAPTGIPFTVLHAGRLIRAPVSVREALSTPLISTAGKIRALRDLFTAAPRPDESVAEALTRKLGREISTRLAAPLLGGLYASDPARMEARDTLIPALERAGGGRSLLLALRRAAKWERIPVVSFTGGMGALPHALVERHREHVHLGAPVTGIERRPPGGFDLVAGNQRVAVDEVVLTLPAPEAAPLVRSISPDAGDRLAALRYNPLAVVPLVAADDTGLGAGLRRMGSGFKVTLEDDFATRGVTAHEALFDRKGLFTAFLGGMGREEVLDRPDREILEIARTDFRRITGTDATPLLVHRTRMPAWDRSWRALDGLELPKGIRLCAAYTDRPGIPGRLESARRTAEKIASA
ncbi:MAG: protoporphyrinogen oxidase [Gemmatimonadetes bacterium]|nr:protoporphyrinogen oxidase [Gemmatimonadota bacterium]